MLSRVKGFNLMIDGGNYSGGGQGGVDDASGGGGGPNNKYAKQLTDLSICF